MLTKLISVFSSFTAALVAVFLFSAAPAFAATCTPTGFFRDGINMTAAIKNPTLPVTGSIDATGCNVGVYYGPGKLGSVMGANIHGANYYGVVAQKANVNVQNSNINHIGETPLNGSQHGVGIYFATIAGVSNGDCTTGSTTGSIQNNSVSTYQKGGIVTACTGTNVAVQSNTVTGQGPVDYIAQNGIQIGYGAKGQIAGNTVTGNAYSGLSQAASGGILVVGGDCYGGDYTKNLTISNNILKGNDVGVYLSNLDGTCSSPSSVKTSINVNLNKITNDGLTNKTGNGPTQGYQAGISDQGNGDSVIINTISGSGYNPANSSALIFTTWIDTAGSNNANLVLNNTN